MAHTHTHVYDYKLQSLFLSVLLSEINKFIVKSFKISTKLSKTYSKYIEYIIVQK